MMPKTTQSLAVARSNPVLGKIKAIIRLILLALLSIAVMISQTIILSVYRGPASYLIPILWERGARRIFGVKIITVGKPVCDRQVIYMSNHLSYIDIPVLGSLVYGSFVARGDVRQWPIWGYLGSMQQTVYISRDPKHIAREKPKLDKMIADGKNLIIFPEGTSSNGAGVLPFKSSFFSLAYDDPNRKITIQPVTITVLEMDGKPAAHDQAVRDIYAWYGEMDLMPHMWRLAQLKGGTVQVEFHAPHEAANYPDRKALCAACETDVMGGRETLARAA